MKKIQNYRFAIQLLCLILTSVSFLINFKITLLIILILTLLSGAFYCGWVCPFGFIQDSFSNIGTAFGIKKRKMPKSLHKIFKFSRYILAVLVILSGSDFIFSILTFDPRSNFGIIISGDLIAVSAFIIIILFCIISLFFERPFCNYLCIQGAKYGVLSLLRPITIRRNEDMCIGCKKCDSVCPMHIEVSKIKNLRDPHCINCFQCITACPLEVTLSYGWMKLDKKEKKRYFIILITIAILTFGFLGYNTFAKNNSSSIENSATTATTATTSKVYKGETNIAKGISNGTYTGSSKGYKGTVVVKINVENEILTGVEVVSYDDDEKWFERAKTSIIPSIVQSQNTDVDMVAGATHSSSGIKNSIINALKNAK